MSDRRVLLIEDEPNIIEAIRFILSRDGWRVDTHSNGLTAIDAIRERAIGAVENAGRQGRRRTAN